MSWGAVAGAAVGVVGGPLANKGKDKNGGAGTTTATKEPWMDAAPWLREIINQGTHLNNAYASNPFSAAQQQAYSNQYALSDGVRGLIPELLGQLGQQPVGFDPSNPTARAKAFDWRSILGANSAGTGYGLQGNDRLLDVSNASGPTTARWIPPSASAPSGGESAPVAPAVTPNWEQMFMAGTGDRNANFLP